MDVVKLANMPTLPKKIGRKGAPVPVSMLKLQNREHFTGKISTKSSHANMVQDLNNQKRSTPQHGGKHQRTNPMLTYLFNTMSPLRKVKL